MNNECSKNKNIIERTYVCLKSLKISVGSIFGKIGIKKAGILWHIWLSSKIVKAEKIK